MVKMREMGNVGTAVNSSPAAGVWLSYDDMAKSGGKNVTAYSQYISRYGEQLQVHKERGMTRLNFYIDWVVAKEFGLPDSIFQKYDFTGYPVWMTLKDIAREGGFAEATYRKGLAKYGYRVESTNHSEEPKYCIDANLALYFGLPRHMPAGRYSATKPLRTWGRGGREQSASHPWKYAATARRRRQDSRNKRGDDQDSDTPEEGDDAPLEERLDNPKVSSPSAPKESAISAPADASAPNPPKARQKRHRNMTLAQRLELIKERYALRQKEQAKIAEELEKGDDD
jgi:hypothetical protein